MLDFVPLSIRECLGRSAYANSDIETSFESDKELHIVGQQKDGSILVTGKSSESGTSIAVVDIESENAKFLTKTKTETNIIYATVSSDQKLLAFVVQKDFLPKHLMSPHRNEYFEHTRIYQAFVVRLEPELTSQDTWLPVTVCHSCVIHVHFLEPEVLDPSAPMGLLTLTHNHSIQLHQVHSHGGVHIVGSQVLGISFDWAQWLPEQHCLLYIATPSCPERQPRTLSCVQFCGTSQYSTVFNLSASAVGIRDEFVNTIREPISITSLNKISVDRLNLDVILWKEGTVCICHQSPPSMRNAWKVSSARDGTEHVSSTVASRSRHHSSPGNVDVLATKNGEWVDDEALESTYTITMLHHGCQIHCTQRADRPEALWPMRFLPVDEHHLLVFSPDMPCHLLDVDPNHEPVHHIVDVETVWPFGSQSKFDCVLIPRRGITFLAERQTCRGFLALLEPDKLIELFVRNDSARNRTSIVHYLAAHTDNYDYIQKLLDVLQKDIWNIEVTTFLQEMLLGKTFARTRQSHPTCQGVLYHLPFTTISSNDGEDGGLRISCMYEHLSTDPLLLASSKSDSDAADVWQLLWNYQKSFRKRKVMTAMNPELGLQFQLDNVARRCSDGETNRGETYICPQMFSGKSPFCFSELCTLCMRGNQTNTESPPDIREIVRRIKHPFPVSDLDEEALDFHILTTSTWKQLFKFLSQSCPSASRSFLNKVATTYVAAQVCQTNILCSRIFSHFDIAPHEDKGDFDFIEEMPTEKLCLLSSLSERFLVAARSLAFPLPDGFAAACTVMAFQSTPFLIFMQFIQNGAYKLRKNIVSYLLKRLDDDSPENIQKKLLLIGHLPKSDGEELLADSMKGIGNRFYAVKKARDNLTMTDKNFPKVLRATEDDVETALFPLAGQTEYGIDANNFT